MFGLKSLPPKRLLTEIILGVVCLLSVYAFIALLSFHPTDPSWSQTAWQAPILNWGGYCGAIIADVLLVSFGIIAYAFPFLILFFCLNSAYFIYKRTFNAECFLRLTTVLIGFVLFMLSTCTLASINIDDIYFYPSGGFIGSMVASTLFPLLGFVGVTLLLVVVFMISITLLTNMSWLALADSLGYAVYASGKWCLRITRRADTQPKKAEGISKEKNTQNEKNPLELETVLELNELGQSFDLHKNCLVIDENQLNLSFDSSKVASQQYLVSEDVIDTSYPPKFRYQAGGGKKTKSDGIGIFAYSYQPIEINENLHVNRIIDIENEHNKKSIIENVSATHSASVIADDVNVSAEKEISLSCINVFNDSAEREYEQTTFNESSLDQAQEDEENGVSTAACTVLLSGETRNKVKNESEPELGEELEPEPMSVIHPLLMRNEVPLIKPTTPLPSLDLLIAPPKHIAPVDHQQLKAMANRIESALADYRVNVEVVDYFQGPVVTLYELALAPGVKASRISALSRDLARALSVTAVRVAEVVPGKPYVGLELPNPKRQTVYISEVLDSPAFRDARSKLTVVLGKDISGQSVVMDIAKTPHLLVAGTTGSGKSVGVNAMIISMLYKASPEDVRFIMIDPKMLELSVYEGIPHLLTQVVTDMKDAANALRWCVGEMERRYKLMSALGVRNLAGYNECIDKAEAMGRPIPDPLWKRSESMSDEIPTLKHLHYIVVIVDEFADLIMAVGKKVEELIARLAQKARAAGIHLVLATQRPSVDVITGLIKANIPSRIAFTVSSKIDSRTILDQGGAESLLGMGDMLYLAPNSSLPVRVHGAFVRDEEVHAVVQDWKARGRPDYIESITAGDEEKESEDKENSFEEELDPLFDQAVEFIIEKRRASISSVQRQFRIGYNRAARIIEQMEIQGILSSPNHNGVREILARHEQND